MKLRGLRLEVFVFFFFKGGENENVSTGYLGFNFQSNLK